MPKERTGDEDQVRSGDKFPNTGNAEAKQGKEPQAMNSQAMPSQDVQVGQSAPATAPQPQPAANPGQETNQEKDGAAGMPQPQPHTENILAGDTGPQQPVTDESHRTSMSGDGVAGIPPDKGVADMNAQSTLGPATQKPFLSQGNPGAVKPGALATGEQPPAPVPPPKPQPISKEDVEEQQRKQLVALYGPDYIEARKGQAETYFSRRAWDLLGPAGRDGSKDGWKPVVKTPPEVKRLQKEQQG